VVLPVAALLCWRRGQSKLAVALLTAPLAAWALWELAGKVLSPFARGHLGVGLLPVLLLAPVAALAWLASMAMADDEAAAFLARATLPTWVTTGLRLSGIPALAWFLYGFLRLESSCVMDAGSLRSHLPRVLLCASSAAGAWPLLVPALLGGVKAFVRNQRAGDTRDGALC